MPAKQHLSHQKKANADSTKKGHILLQELQIVQKYKLTAKTVSQSPNLQTDLQRVNNSKTIVPSLGNYKL